MENKINLDKVCTGGLRIATFYMYVAPWFHKTGPFKPLPSKF